VIAHILGLKAVAIDLLTSWGIRIYSILLETIIFIRFFGVDMQESDGNSDQGVRNGCTQKARNARYVGLNLIMRYIITELQISRH